MFDVKYVPFTWQQFDEAVDIIVESLRVKGLMSKVSQVYGIPRGGLVLAVALSHRLNVSLVQSLDDVIVGDGTLIVDDISDSGQTLRRFGPLGVCAATIHKVPNTVCVPDVWVFERGVNEWIVYPWEGSINGQRKS